MAFRAPGLDQADSGVRVGREAVRENATGRAGADYDVVELALELVHFVAQRRIPGMLPEMERALLTGSRRWYLFPAASGSVYRSRQTSR